MKYSYHSRIILTYKKKVKTLRLRVPLGKEPHNFSLACEIKPRSRIICPPTGKEKKTRNYSIGRCLAKFHLVSSSWLKYRCVYLAINTLTFKEQFY